MRIDEFEKQVIRSKSVLIVEPNRYHGEILPGFTTYFQDLGFYVDLFTRNEVHAESPFSLFRNNAPRTFHGDSADIATALKDERISEYDYIFFSTNVLWESGVFVGSYLSYLGFVPKARFGILAVEHNLPFLIEDGAEYQLRQGRVFTLSEEAYGGGKTLMLNPHRFGAADYGKRNDHVTRFAVVGGVSRQAKNIDLLFSSVQRLLKERRGNFDVTIIGSGELEIPDPLQGHIKFLGRKDFNALYSTMTEVDYLLPLLDSGRPEHEKYLHGTSSGIVQLSLGFHVPMVIDGKFSERYGFAERNCVRYVESDLYWGILDAIQMKGETYDEMRDQIELKASEVYSKSLGNLKAALMQCENNAASASIVDDATLEVLRLRDLRNSLSEEINSLSEEINSLSEEIKRMKASKFWKLRGLYLSLKNKIWLR
jgi:hypothetical protein